jgi:hypothetical protein
MKYERQNSMMRYLVERALARKEQRSPGIGAVLWSGRFIVGKEDSIMDVAVVKCAGSVVEGHLLWFRIAP